MAASYGYTGYYKPPQIKKPNLAAAAAGHTSNADPFGLLTDTTDSARVARQNATPQTPGTTVIPAASHPAAGNGMGGVNVGAAPRTPVGPPTPAAYDINTDPALQTVNALTGMNDEQARAQALQQKQQQLLSYGDPSLVQGLLGDATLAQAAGANPTSTLAGLSQQRDRNTHDLTENLNKQNLGYSGYRVTQETQAGQDYQNALAQAAAGVNSNLGGIDSALAQALGQNQAQRIAAMQDAYGRHATDPGYDPNRPDGGTGVDTGPLTDTRSSGYAPQQALYDLLLKNAQDSNGRRGGF